MIRVFRHKKRSRIQLNNGGFVVVDLLLVKRILLLCFLGIGISSFAVANSDSSLVNLKFEFENAPKKFDAKKLKLPDKSILGWKVPLEQKKVLQQLYASGFVEAERLKVDTLGNRIISHYSLGKQYTWEALKSGNVDEGVLSKIGFRDKLYLNQSLSYAEIRSLFKRLVQYYENNGYPFCSVKLDSVDIKNAAVSAQLYVELNKKITIDTIKIKGSYKISPNYIFNYIGVKQGDLYNEKQIREIETRIKELPFVSSIKVSEVDFYADKTTLTLYLNHKKANNFDGIIGFQPDEVTGDVTITGDIKIHLKNALGYGEEVELNWKRQQTQTQEILARLRYPFLFNTPFGIEGKINIYRRDTTFNIVTTNLSLQYIFRGGDFVEVFWENQNNNLISTYNMDIVTELPENADVRVNSFGIGGKVNELDYRLNPRRGFSFTARAGFGNREIRQNPAINPVVYDSLTLKTNSYKSTATAEFFIPFFKRQTVQLKGSGGLLAAEKVFNNELYRIGGLRTLRGFDEESIFASSYLIGTLEYRFLLEQNSYLSVFYQQAWYENQASKELITDTPFGFGAGISFETKIGIFSLNYALGKQFSNPILFRASKIHFGFVNYF